MRELPTIATGTYAATALNLASAIGVDNAGGWVAHPPERMQEFVRRVQVAPQIAQTITATPTKEKPVMASRRLVQVFIADPDENVPVADCLLHRGEPVLTDATDQELFFEIDIKTILDAHNAKRVKLIDKKVKERTENLEPAKIRDLKMTVVTIATF